MAVNLVQTEDIGAFFLRQVEGDTELAGWLETALTPSLLRREKSAVALTQMPYDAPEWLIKKWEAGGPFHRFHADDELVNKVGHIVDWLAAARRENAPFLQKRDPSGVPLKMRNLDLEAAFNAANKYFERFNRCAPADLDPFGNVKTVMEFRNGWRMVQLVTPAAIATEGKNMNHCLGTYIDNFKKGWMFFSLRDRDGEPHVSLSLRETLLLDQCRGRGGFPPAEKYLADIVAFLNSKNAHIPGHHRDLPGYFRNTDGVIVPRSELPPESAPDSFMLLKSPATQVPGRPLFTGGVYIDGCPNLEEITDGLVVTGGLHIKDCFALRKIAREVPVGGQLTLDTCGIEELYINYQMDGDVRLRNCWRLKNLEFHWAIWKSLEITDCDQLVLPETVRVSNWLVFRDMKRQTHIPGGFRLIYGSLSVQDSEDLISIGDNISVEGNVCFQNLPNLKSLPDRMHIDGGLYIDNCGITELPSNITVNGYVTIANCKNLERMYSPIHVKDTVELENCPKLKFLPPFANPPKAARVYRCPALGPVLPPHFNGCPSIATDLFLTEAFANM